MVALYYALPVVALSRAADRHRERQPSEYQGKQKPRGQVWGWGAAGSAESSGTRGLPMEQESQDVPLEEAR